MGDEKKVAIYLDLTQVHQQGIAGGILHYARERGNWQLFGAYWPMLAVDDFRNWRGDGIIGDIYTTDDLGLIAQTNIPIVDTSGAIRHPALYTITNDNLETGRLAAAHLIGNGYASFAFCGAEGIIWSDERLEGFRQGLGTAQSREPHVFLKKIAWWHTTKFSPALGKWLAKWRRPLAVFAANDIVGMNVVGACRLEGLRIPDDVAVVGVDNEVMLCELSHPPMSSFPFDSHELGWMAAERLDALMSGTPASKLPPVRIKPQPVVERASSAGLAFADPAVREALAIIRKNATRFLSVSDVAKTLNLSLRHLERRFRTHVGFTMLEEIHRVRIDHAKHLLRDTDLPLVKVAFRCGFRTPVRFNHIFQRLSGETPKAYRNHGESVL